MIYFDHSSSTFCDSSVLESYIKVEQSYIANADSLHNLGIESQKLLTQARKKTAMLLKVAPEELIYTSGASESNSLAICGYYNAYKNRGNHILVACGEHSSTKKALLSLETAIIEEIPLNEAGNIDLNVLEKLIRKETILICVSSIQNEFGSIRDIDAIGKLAHRFNIAVFVDAAQHIGKEPFDFTNVDMVSISAHKMHGIKGSGLLIKKKNIRLKPIIFGGQQEYGLRGGTSNLAMQVALAKTLRLAIDNQQRYSAHIKELNQYLRLKLSKFDTININSSEQATDYILNFSCVNLPSQVMLNAFNVHEIYLSAISTCVSRSEAITSVSCIEKRLEVINGVLRVSFAYTNTKAEIDCFIEVLHNILQQYKV